MARDFDGAADVLTLASAPVTAVPITLAAWIRSDSVLADQAIVGVMNASTFNVFILMALGATGGDPISARSGDGATFPEGLSTGGFTANTWHHAGAVFASATSRTAYLDGVAGTANTTSNTPSGINAAGIGNNRFTGFDAWFDGDIAEVGIWNVALTTGEMAALADGVSPARIRPASLVRYPPVYGIASPETDWMSSTGWTVVSAPPVSDHPPRVRPPWARTHIITAAAAAADLEINVFETATVTDDDTVAEVTVLYTVDQFESVTSTDVDQVAVTPLTIDVSEAVTVADVDQVAITPLNIAPFEAVTVVDDDTVVRVDVGALSISPFETVTVADVDQVARTPHLISSVETVTVTDVDQVARTPHVISAAETVTVVDDETVTLSAVGGIEPAPFETVTVTDVDQVAVTPFIVNVFDAVTVSESTAVGIERIISEAETVTVSDVATVSLAADVNPSVSETVSVVDVDTVSVGTVRLTLSEAEAVTVTDVASVVSTPLTINVSETVTAADVATVVETPLVVSATELVTVADSAEISVASPSIPRLSMRTLFVSPSRRTVAATARRTNTPVAS